MHIQHIAVHICCLGYAFPDPDRTEPLPVAVQRQVLDVHGQTHCQGEP